MVMYSRRIANFELAIHLAVHSTRMHNNIVHRHMMAHDTHKFVVLYKCILLAHSHMSNMVLEMNIHNPTKNCALTSDLQKLTLCIQQTLLSVLQFAVLGVVAGFAMSNYSGVEGESIPVCVTVHFPNATILSMSDFEGQFRVTGSGECLHYYFLINILF